MQDFRRAVRDHSPQSPCDWRRGLETEVSLAASHLLAVQSEQVPPEAVSFLCGCWQDQPGSVYKLFAGGVGAFHVETTCPNGHVAMVCGREHIMCGRCRSELEICDSNGVFWRGRSECGAFLWRRAKPEIW